MYSLFIYVIFEFKFKTCKLKTSSDILTVKVSTCIKIPHPGKEYFFHGY